MFYLHTSAVKPLEARRLNESAREITAAEAVDRDGLSMLPENELVGVDDESNSANMAVNVSASRVTTTGAGISYTVMASSLSITCTRIISLFSSDAEPLVSLV